LKNALYNCMADNEDSFHSVYYDAPTTMIFPEPKSLPDPTADPAEATTTMAVPSPQSPTPAPAPSPLLTTHRIPEDGERHPGDDSFSKGPWNASAGGGDPNAVQNISGGVGSPSLTQQNAGNLGTPAGGHADVNVIVVHEGSNVDGLNNDKTKLEGAHLTQP
jgi:hypothetical protein